MIGRVVVLACLVCLLAVESMAGLCRTGFGSALTIFNVVSYSRLEIYVSLLSWVHCDRPIAVGE